MADRRKGGLSRARGGPRPWARCRKWARGSTAFNRETDFLTACEAAVKDKTFDINGRYSLSIEIVVSSSESQEIFVLVPEISMWRWRIFFLFLIFTFLSTLGILEQKIRWKIRFHTREKQKEKEGKRERESCYDFVPWNYFNWKFSRGIFVVVCFHCRKRCIWSL